MKINAIGFAALSLFAGAALFAADINIGSDTLWNAEGVIGGQTYTADDKIHIRSNSPTAIPTVTFDFEDETAVDAVVLGWNNSSPTAAGSLIMNKGLLSTNGVSIGIATGTPSGDLPRESSLIMNSGSSLVINGKDDNGVDYNGFFIAKSSVTDPEFHATGSATLNGAYLTFINTYANRSSLLSVGTGQNSIATFTASAGSIIKQNTKLSGENKFFVRVGEGIRSNGTMTLTGSGTILDLTTGAAIQNNDGFVVGYGENSVGIVNVRDRAEISQSTSDGTGTMRMIIGGGKNSNGTLNVDGAGSMVDFSSIGYDEVLQIGRGEGATGTLNITNGGLVTNQNVGNEGTIDMYMGKSAGSVANMNISGAGSEFYFKSDKGGGTGGRLYVGGVGGSIGNVTIKDGGKMDLYAKALVVGTNGATGNLTIDNASYVSSYYNNPDFVIARTAGSTGNVELKNGGKISISTNANMTIYMGGDWDNKNNGSATTSTLKVHGENSEINLAGNSSLLVGYSKNAKATVELYNKANITVNNLGLGLAEASDGTFKMWGGATANVNTFGMGVSMTSSSQGISNAYAEILGEGTALTVSGNLTMGTTDASKNGSLKLVAGNGARVKVNGTLAINQGASVSFNIGGKDLVGADSGFALNDAVLTVGTLAVADIANAAINIVGSDAAAIALGDFKVYLLDFTSSALTQAQIESLVNIDGFDSKYWQVGALEWDGNKLYLNLTVINVIPEPGEIVAIFGLLALAFAAYRRKK